MTGKFKKGSFGAVHEPEEEPAAAPTGAVNEDAVAEAMMRTFKAVAEGVVAPQLRNVLQLDPSSDKSPVIILVGSEDGKLHAMMAGQTLHLHAMMASTLKRLQAAALIEEYERLMKELGE